MSTAVGGLKVIPEASEINLGLRKGLVVLESANIHDLVSMDASKLAIETAASSGLVAAAIKNRGSPYPVNGDGSIVSDVTKGFPQGGKYRIDYELGSSL